MTNFQAENNRPTAAWLTPERAVLVVPILAGLALAATLASAVITPQLVQLRERRSVIDVLEQKSNALPELVEALAQRRLEQAEVMAQQQRLLALIAGNCAAGNVSGAAQRFGQQAPGDGVVNGPWGR